ncbi:MAG: hypothetical protein WCJ66_16695 [Verrucomicrobiota bacterium]
MASPAPWVLLLRGEAVLQFESGVSLTLTAGDPLLIPAHCRHRLFSSFRISCLGFHAFSSLWLALHYQEEPDAARPQ